MAPHSTPHNRRFPPEEAEYIRPEVFRRRRFFKGRHCDKRCLSGATEEGWSYETRPHLAAVSASPIDLYAVYFLCLLALCLCPEITFFFLNWVAVDLCRRLSHFFFLTQHVNSIGYLHRHKLF